MQATLFSELESCLEKGQLVVVATIIDGPGRGRQLLIRSGEPTLGDLGSPSLNRSATKFGEQVATTFASDRKTFTLASEPVDVFFDVLPPRPELVIVGAVHVAIPLVEFGKTMGFRTVVIDPRGAFATPERFSQADQLIRSWPAEALAELGLHKGSFVVVLSHDLKIDLPALEAAIRSPARYIGALGSKKTHAKRVSRLEEKGFDSRQIGRIHAPIGL
ncbi:MAG: XdhC family protein, partial [Acidobacteriota bacterium]